MVNISYFQIVLFLTLFYDIFLTNLHPEIRPMIIDPTEKISDIHDVGIGKNDVSSYKMKSQLWDIKTIIKIA